MVHMIDPADQIASFLLSCRWQSVYVLVRALPRDDADGLYMDVYQFIFILLHQRLLLFIYRTVGLQDHLARRLLLRQHFLTVIEAVLVFCGEPATRKLTRALHLLLDLL